jgi:hypothetical protein
MKLRDTDASACSETQGLRWKYVSNSVKGQRGEGREEEEGVG